MSPYQFESLLSENGLVHATSARPDPDSLKQHASFQGKNERQSMAETGYQSLFLNSLGIKEQSLNVLKQIHSSRVVVVEEGGGANTLEGDAMVTAQPGQAIGVTTADCVPVLLFDPVTRTAGAVHAGRAGTGLGIVPEAIRKMTDQFGVQPANLKVALGPSIGPCCYEVGEDCLTLFQEMHPEWRDWVKPHAAGKVLLDLWAANRDQALGAGVPGERISLSGECTACHVERWYSYRREGQKAGRMLTVIMLDER